MMEERMLKVGTYVKYHPNQSCALVVCRITSVDDWMSRRYSHRGLDYGLTQVSHELTDRKYKYCTFHIGSEYIGVEEKFLITTKWRCEMNKLIVEMFPKTKDAVLIEKHFGTKLDDPIFKMLLKGKEKELLQEAQKMEEDELKAKK